MTGKAPRLRALIIAESCNPEWESVALLGWSHARAVSELADVHIVTRNWNRENLTRAGLVEGVDYTALDTDALFRPAEAVVRWLSGPGRGWAMLTGLSIPAYIAFEWLLWRRFRRDIRAGRFDVVHRITPVSPAVPSILARRCRRAGVPFVLGPINGGVPWPAEFPDLRRREREFLSRFRGLYRAVPGYWSTRQSAAAVVVGSASARADLPVRWHAKAVYMPENGIDPARFPPPAPRSAGFYRGRVVKVVFLGRLVPFKGADILLDAAAPLLAAGRLSLDIIGWGPEEERLRAMVAAMGAGAAVTFAGKIPHDSVAERLAGADLLALPSVREFGGAVVLEAMAAGLVPVVVRYGGPAELVSPASGFLLPLSDRPALVGALRATLEAVVADPGQLAAMSASAVQRARALFTWPAKARQTLGIYEWVTGRQARKPDPPIPFPDPDGSGQEASA